MGTEDGDEDGYEDERRLRKVGYGGGQYGGRSTAEECTEDGVMRRTG
jgi:hypothetical protein